MTDFCRRREELTTAPFSLSQYLRMHARILALAPKAGVHRWVKDQYRDYIYNEQLEALTIAPGPVGNPNDPKSPANPNTWLGDNSITNNVQAQVGISIFLPFSWEYRLPK